MSAQTQPKCPLTSHRPGYSVIDLPFGFNVKTVRVHSTARVVGQPNMFACSASVDIDSGTISLEKGGTCHRRRLCAVFSNSTHTKSITSKEQRGADRELYLFARGGKDGGKGNFNPASNARLP
nr:hypothetical protein [uncultured Brevundimonas sp.]